MLDVTLIGAFLGGLLSFVSPCVLPLVPPYLCYVAGITYEELAQPDGRAQNRVILSSIAFVLGFSLVFVAFGATASAMGQVISDYAGILTKLAGGLIILFGLHFLGVIKIGLFHRQARFEADMKGGLLGAFLLGLAFAFGWTPCVGPILAAILFMAGSEDSVGSGISLLVAYAMGIGLPFILAAVFTTKFLSIARGMRKHMAVIEKVSGVFLIVTGLLFIFGGMEVIGYTLLELFPALGESG